MLNSDISTGIFLCSQGAIRKGVGCISMACFGAVIYFAARRRIGFTVKLLKVVLDVLVDYYGTIIIGCSGLLIQV